jgi:hypothetical protein
MAINDKWGHQSEDAVLQRVPQAAESAPQLGCDPPLRRDEVLIILMTSRSNPMRS